MYYTNEATEDYREWLTPIARSEESDNDRSLELHNLIWSPDRAIDNRGAIALSGLTSHQFGCWKVEGTQVIGFNGGSRWQYCATQITPQIAALLA